MSSENDRGTGRTTKQLLAAPLNAVFVTNEANYTRNLVIKHGRPDIQVVNWHWILDRRWVGRTFSAIILDHAIDYTNDEFSYMFNAALTRVRS